MKKQFPLDWQSHLVVRAQAGEGVAFELLIDTYREAMTSLARRMLHDGEDASDAVQNAVLKALRGLGAFQAGRPVLPWLLRITTNCCLDALRQRRVQCESLERHEFALSAEVAPAGSELEASMEAQQVAAAIDRLPNRYRDIILMRHFRQMEVGEIASALDKPEGTIKSWLFRARALLRKDLQVALG